MTLGHDVARKHGDGVRWCYLGEKSLIERGLGIGGLDVPSLNCFTMTTVNILQFSGEYW